MIQNLVYSLNATVPIFLMILIGYVFKRRGLLNENFVSIANKIVFHFSLPLLLFQDLSKIDVKKVFDLRYVSFCFLVTTFCFFCIWGGAELFIKDKTQIGAFVQASFRSSAAVLGIAFIYNIYGEIGFAPLMIIGTVPIYNIYSVIVLTFRSKKQNQKGLIQKALIRIVTNPILIGIFTGLVFSFFRLRLPVMIDQTFSHLSSMSTPLALLAIGAGFKFPTQLKDLKLAFVSTFIKLILQPALFLPLAVFLGYRGQEIIALLVMLGAPTTVTCYIMAKNMNNDEDLSSTIIVLTTILASITLTFWIYLLKMLQIL